MIHVNEEYLKKIPEQRILERLWYFEKAFEITLPESDIRDTFNVNKDILYLVARSYFLDIERLKHFHGIDRIEKYKIAAYTIKWICRLRPIYFESSDKIVQNPQQYLMNEQYALELGCAMAGIEKSIITPAFLKEALYSLHYRNLSVDALVMWLKALGGSVEAYAG